VPLVHLPLRRALLCGLAGLPLAGPARAHALVLTSQPAPASRGRSPGAVALRFNSRIDHSRSRLTLHGPDNATRALTVAPAEDPALLEAPVPWALAPGDWRLRWQVLALDGHITRGDIFFTVEAR
jgi:methionine-rich copper-binding protein CopC